MYTTSHRNVDGRSPTGDVGEVADDPDHAQDDLPLLPRVLRHRGRGRGQPRARGPRRPEPRGLAGLHVREGTAAPGAAPRPRASPRDVAAPIRRWFRRAPERAGDGRGGGEAAGDHRRARAPVGRALQRHEVVGERVVRARPELARGHRLAVLLHHRHRRPAGEEHGRRAARLLAGRPPPHRGLRRRPVRRHEPAPVVPGRGREAPLPERARRTSGSTCSGGSTSS